MKMEMPSENQISSSSSSSLCFFRHHLLCVAVLGFFLVSTSFFSTSPVIFTFSLLILSTFLVVFKFSASPRKTHLMKDEMILSFTQKNPELKNEVCSSNKETQVAVPHQDYVFSKTSDSSSETADISSSSSEDSDADLGEFTMFSDDSISDDESLIEIDLPGGHYIGAKEEAKFLNIEATLKQFLKEPIFKQQSLMELLADMYEEEENLIEIDISMGSIKCSRLEIEA